MLYKHLICSTENFHLLLVCFTDKAHEQLCLKPNHTNESARSVTFIKVTARLALRSAVLSPCTRQSQTAPWAFKLYFTPRLYDFFIIEKPLFIQAKYFLSVKMTFIPWCEWIMRRRSPEPWSLTALKAIYGPWLKIVLTSCNPKSALVTLPLRAK